MCLVWKNEDYFPVRAGEVVVHINARVDGDDIRWKLVVRDNDGPVNLP